MRTRKYTPMMSLNALEAALPLSPLLGALVVAVAILSAGQLDAGTVALLVALAGLAAVLSEILAKDPALLLQIATDVEKMARPEAQVAPAEAEDPAPELRKAA